MILKSKLFCYDLTEEFPILTIENNKTGRIIMEVLNYAFSRQCNKSLPITVTEDFVKQNYNNNLYSRIFVIITILVIENLEKSNALSVFTKLNDELFNLILNEMKKFETSLISYYVDENLEKGCWPININFRIFKDNWERGFDCRFLYMIKVGIGIIPASVLLARKLRNEAPPNIGILIDRAKFSSTIGTPMLADSNKQAIKNPTPIQVDICYAIIKFYRYAKSIFDFEKFTNEFSGCRNNFINESIKIISECKFKEKLNFYLTNNIEKFGHR